MGTSSNHQKYKIPKLKSS